MVRPAAEIAHSDSRQRLIDAAIEAFRKEGYRATEVRHMSGEFRPFCDLDPLKIKGLRCSTQKLL